VEEYLNEKEQWERVLAWLREQGPWIVAGVALALAVYGGWNYWQNRTQQRNLAAAARYEQVIEAFGRNDVNAGSRLADELVKAYPSTAYADQANLAVARIQVENKQLEPAATRLRQVLAATSDPELALVARLRLARATRKCAAMYCSQKAIATGRSRLTARHAAAATPPPMAGCSI
jgi:predicted negative regulator of RcsB-dependent stress response